VYDIKIVEYSNGAKTTEAYNFSNKDVSAEDIVDLIYNSQKYYDIIAHHTGCDIENTLNLKSYNRIEGVAILYECHGIAAIYVESHFLFPTPSKYYGDSTNIHLMLMLNEDTKTLTGVLIELSDIECSMSAGDRLYKIPSKNKWYSDDNIVVLASKEAQRYDSDEEKRKFLFRYYDATRFMP